MQYNSTTLTILIMNASDDVVIIAFSSETELNFISFYGYYYRRNVLKAFRKNTNITTKVFIRRLQQVRSH